LTFQILQESDILRETMKQGAHAFGGRPVYPFERQAGVYSIWPWHGNGIGVNRKRLQFSEKIAT